MTVKNAEMNARNVELYIVILHFDFLTLHFAYD